MTFKEIQEKLMAAKYKTVIYQHLIDHLESDFRPSSGNQPKKVLLTEDKIPVPDGVIEGVVKELFGGLSNVAKEMDQILTMPIPQATPTQATTSSAAPTAQAATPIGSPVPAPVPAPVSEAVTSEPQGRKKIKN